MRLPRFHRCPRLGFTLIELMVVVLLVGIMTALILPEMRGTYQDALLRSASRQLVSACRLAQSRAVTFNQVHLLRLDRETGRCRVEGVGHPSGRGGAAIGAGDIPGGEATIDSRIVIQMRPQEEPPPERAVPDGAPASQDDQPGRFPADAIAFYPDGTADRAEIHLRDQEGFGLALRINPITAHVQIHELKRQ